MEDSSVLDLRGKKLTDVCEIQNRTLSNDQTRLLNVVTLDLSFNLLTQLTNLTAEGWPALKELKVGSNQVSGGLEGLQRFTRLTSLSLDNNLLSTCKGLGGLESLKTLRLDGNRITDTRGLARLTNLTSLDLSRNQIKKLQGLSNLVRLEELTLDHNQLTSLEGLGKCTGLTELSLRSNRVTDLAGLAPLTRLDVLRLEENGVEGLDSMPTLPDLTELHVGRNRLSSLDGLPDKLPSLEILDAGGNALPSLELCARALARFEALAELTLAGNPLCQAFQSNHGYRKAARGALPSLSFLDSFPVSQAEVPADQHSSAKEGMASKADVSGRPLESTENSRSPPGAWEPLDDPFAPSLKEMEAFKRRMGIHPDVDPFGRPSTASRDSGGGPERSRTETETGTDGKAKASEADGGMHRLRKVEEFDEGTRGGSKTAVSGGEHRTEAGSGTEPESAAARARQRHVTRVEAALADMGERLTSYHTHVTSVIANLRQRLVAPTLDAAAAAMLDNGYLVTATRALPAVPHIDLETPPGEDDDVSERTTDVSKGDAGSGRRGSGDLGGLGSERNGKGAEETEDGVPNGTARGGGQNKEREGVLRKARKLSANKTFVQELRSGTGAVPTGLYGTSSGKPSSSRNGTEELPGKADVRGLVRRRMSADAAMVNRNVTVESLERATRILPRGSRQIGADRGSELERAALTERGRRDTVRVAELGGKGNGTGNGNGNGVRMESDVSVGRHKTGWGDRRAPKAVWLEEPRGTDSRMKGTAGEVRTTGPKGADVSVAEGKVGDKEKEVSSNVSEAARPAKEALELFYKMFPESAVDERADSAGKENVVGGTAKRERHSWKEARSEATAVGSQVFAHRTARSAPAADYTRKSMPESIPEEKRVEKETTRQGRPFESKFAVPSERLKTGSGEKDRPLKLPLIPLTPTGQVQKSGRTKW